jgi:hypothetical protein
LLPALAAQLLAALIDHDRAGDVPVAPGDERAAVDIGQPQRGHSLADDPGENAAEWLAEWRDELSSYIPRTLIEARRSMPA